MLFCTVRLFRLHMHGPRVPFFGHFSFMCNLCEHKRTAVHRSWFQLRVVDVKFFLLVITDYWSAIMVVHTKRLGFLLLTSNALISSCHGKLYKIHMLIALVHMENFTQVKKKKWQNYCRNARTFNEFRVKPFRNIARFHFSIRLMIFDNLFAKNDEPIPCL